MLWNNSVESSFSSQVFIIFCVLNSQLYTEGFPPHLVSTLCFLASLYVWSKVSLTYGRTSPGPQGPGAETVSGMLSLFWLGCVLFLNISSENI